MVATGRGLITTVRGLITTGCGLITTGRGLIITGRGLITTGRGLITTGRGLSFNGRHDWLNRCRCRCRCRHYHFGLYHCRGRHSRRRHTCVLVGDQRRPVYKVGCCRPKSGQKGFQLFTGPSNTSESRHQIASGLSSRCPPCFHRCCQIFAEWAVPEYKKYRLRKFDYTSEKFKRRGHQCGKSMEWRRNVGGRGNKEMETD